MYKDGLLLSKQKKDELINFCLKLLPNVYTYEFNFIKNYINEDRICQTAEQFMEKTFPSISYELVSVDLNDAVFSINLKVDNSSFEHAKSKKLDAVMTSYLKNLFEDFNYNITVASADVYHEDELQKLKDTYVEEEVDIYAKRKIEVTDIVPLIGENIANVADYIVDSKKVMPEVVLCGKLKSVKSIVMKRKPKEAIPDSDNTNEATTKEEAENAENPVATPDIDNDAGAIKYERKMFKWTLVDPTGEINCLFIPTKEHQAKIEKLENGSVVVIKGGVESDIYSGGVIFRGKEIAYCNLPENFEEYIEWRKEKPFYEFVEPEKVVTYAQDNLMNFAEEKEICDYLKNKTFICFDFETTGLHFETGDKIVEIGAVKIEDGIITEKFMCYVNPEKHIPEQASAISGIVDSDVADAPLDCEALQDFYKFTRGAILTGYNILNFDMRFLTGQGKNCRWNFDNPAVDVYHMAQKYVMGVKNYKLGTIAAKLGVVLDNAHRAVYDALATAEVFLKLAPKIAPEDGF